MAHIVSLDYKTAQRYGTVDRGNIHQLVGTAKADQELLMPESSSSIHKNSTFLYWVLFLSAVSFFTTLTHPYYGEEGVYTISSMEMWFHGEWINPTLYGRIYGRPPLFNWLIIPAAQGMGGWEVLLIASRLVSVTATFATAIFLMWVVKRLFKERTLALFVGTIFLSGDLLLRRGWLAYADPLFSLFVFAAIGFSIIAVFERKTHFFCLACLAVMASFLTKALTGYLFFGITLFVLYWQHPNRHFLRSGNQLILLMGSLLFPLVWNHFLSHDSSAHQDMIRDMMSKLDLTNFWHYCAKLALFPLNTLYHFLPISGLVMYCWWNCRKQNTAILAPTTPHLEYFTLFCWILALNYLPYWLAPHARIRYILPLYPVFSIFFGYILYHLGPKIQRISLWFLLFAAILKYVFVFWGYAFIESTAGRGNYEEIAKDILQRTQSYPLCMEDIRATGLSVAAHINVLQLPKPPLSLCSPDGNDDFLLWGAPSYPNTTLIQTYSWGKKDHLYLLCRGKACLD